MVNDLDFRKKFPKREKITAEEFFEFTKSKPENERYELIDGRIYMMASPTTNHQEIIGFIYAELRNYLKGKKCTPFISPLDVVLFEKQKSTNKIQNVFQPDVFVVCDPKKISDKKINGAPDLIFEVVSPASETHDYLRKLNAYLNNGVKEYWVINPETKEITVYFNTKKEEKYKRYNFSDKIKVSIFDDLEIDFKELQI